MMNPKAVCLAYFALLFGLMHVEEIHSNPNVNITNPSPNTTYVSATPSTDSKTQATTVKNNQTATQENTLNPTTYSPATAKPTKEQCIFSLPFNNSLQLIVVVLTVVCLALLMTTLLCTCQVCQLRGIISGLRSRQAVTEKSKSPWRNEDQADGHPTETCVMLLEVNTGQEESKVHEDTENEEPMDPNGDVNQENIQDSDVNLENSHQPDIEPSTQESKEE